MLRQGFEDGVASLLPIAAVDAGSQLDLKLHDLQFLDSMACLLQDVGERPLDGKPHALRCKGVCRDLRDGVRRTVSVLQIDK